MRINTGLLKGMKIKIPDFGPIRPTKASVREALFNILGQELHGFSFTDLCSGSGSIGLEAISRYATQVHFVEQNRRYADMIKDSLREVSRRLEENPGRVYAESFRIFLEREIASDIVYFDPPYGFYAQHDIKDLPFENCVTSGGLLILEHTKKSLEICLRP